VALPRHKQYFSQALVSRLVHVAVPVAVVATALTGAAVISDGPEQGNASQQTPPAGVVATDADLQADRVLRATRDQSAPRASLSRRSTAEAVVAGQVREIEPKVVDEEFATTALNVWTGPGERFTFVSVLPPGSEVSLTDNVNGDWAQIMSNGQARWVRAAYLSNQRPDRSRSRSASPKSPRLRHRQRPPSHRHRQRPLRAPRARPPSKPRTVASRRLRARRAPLSRVVSLRTPSGCTEPCVPTIAR